MSTRGQFNTKNPTIKRILKEASELATNPSPDLHAEPLESNLFEWHFTIRGPPAPSPYAEGLYHGRIVLPSAYPLRPPSFRFLTPSGRFEVNREICLSISGHHEETWQPAWGIRTAMVAIRSFMDTDAKGQVGGVDSTREARERMARESGAWRCGACGKSNALIMREREEAAKAQAQEEGENKKEEVVPEELRLAYREELGEGAAAQQEKATPNDTSSGTSGATARAAPIQADPRPSLPASSNAPSPAPTRTVALPPPRPPALGTNDDVPAWIDKAIYGIIAALLFMVLRKFF